ncbi:MAG: nickel-dependent hydrogenase large subunit [Nitrospirota bacterium]|nr:nickel-dependent hydrogenase large subunit [Nitrospirota bacterium]
MNKVTIDPITRIEGHLKIEVAIENGEVKDAKSSGMLFRGLELILQGRDPRDAQRITQRICGVCPTSHSMAAALNLDSAFGISDKIPENGRIMRNLILGAAHIADHILHFYHLCALDYVDITKVGRYEGTDAVLSSLRKFAERGELGPFVPRYEGDYRLSDDANQVVASHYVEALSMRSKAQKMLSIFGGKMPHNMGVIPGGVTMVPTTDKIISFIWRLNELRDFIDRIYLPDVLAIAEAYSDYFEIGVGCENLLSYGSYDLDGNESDLTKRQRLFRQGTISKDLNFNKLDITQISEEIKYSWYESGVAETEPKFGKEGAYSWIKAPRYGGKVCEVGPLARVMTNYVSHDSRIKELVDSILSKFRVEPKKLFSVLGRHVARAVETKYIADSMHDWLLQLKPGESSYVDYSIPDESHGIGLIEAARGALGHWIEIKDKKIANYQCVVPSTWNLSPRDDRGQPGPVEQALIGTKVKDESNPFEVVRIVRSFDPCIACAVHCIKM